MGFNFFFAALEAFPGVLSAHAGGSSMKTAGAIPFQPARVENAPSFIVIEAMAGSGRNGGSFGPTATALAVP